MYRCSTCLKVSQPKQPLVTYCLMRTRVYHEYDIWKERQEIAKEIPVCQGYKLALDAGVSIADLALRASLFTEVQKPARSVPLAPQPLFGR